MPYEAPSGFAGEPRGPQALRSAAAVLEMSLPTQADVADLRALRDPWRPRTLARRPPRRSLRGS
eukprot:14673784-Alexandrium_andersonii.AAC.1